MFFHFLRTFQLLHIKFFAYVLGNTLSATSLEKPFHSISPSAESHFQVFWSFFFFWGGGGVVEGWGSMYLYILKAAPFCLKKFCIRIFCITLRANIPQLGGEGMGGGGLHDFWAYFEYIPSCILESLYLRETGTASIKSYKRDCFRSKM